MVAAVLLFALGGHSAPTAEPVVVGRGFDTVLDRQAPKVNFGREAVLRGGPDTAILVRFPLVGANLAGDVESAVLELTPTAGGEVRLKSVSVVGQAWFEGGGRRDLPDLGENPLAKGASWEAAIDGPRAVPWTQGDTPIEGARGVLEGGRFTVVGLAPAVRAWLRDPASNQGLRLEFETPCTFWSFDSAERGPRLTLKAEGVPTPPGLEVSEPVPVGREWVATVTNRSLPPSGLEFEWRLDGRTLGVGQNRPGPDAGGQVVLRQEIEPGDRRDPRYGRLTLTVSMGGQTRTAATYTLGVPIDEEVPATTLARLNDVVFPSSRASFAPGGVRERVRRAGSGETGLSLAQLTEWVLGYLGTREATLAAEGAPSLDVRPDGKRLLDTRDESGWLPGVPLPAFPGGTPGPDLPMLPRTQGLPMWVVARLEGTLGQSLAERSGWRPQAPPVMLLRVTDDSGQPVANAAVELRQTSAGQVADPPVFKGQTSDRGSILVPSKEGQGPFGALLPDGSNGWIEVRVTRNGGTASTWLAATTLVVERARGNTAPTVEVRVSLSSGPIRPNPEHAAGRPVTDSEGRLPAALAPLTAPGRTDQVRLAERGWVEVDLGRDRLIGEVALLAPEGRSFKEPALLRVLVRSTGDPAERGRPWAVVAEPREVAEGSLLALRATATRARYVRVEWSGRAAFDLARIQVRGVEAPGG